MRKHQPQASVWIQITKLLLPNLVHTARDTGGAHRLDTLRWTLVPFQTEDPWIDARMLNIRVQTAAKNPFSSSLTKRFAVPADSSLEDGKPTQSGTAIFDITATKPAKGTS